MGRVDDSSSRRVLGTTSGIGDIAGAKHGVRALKESRVSNQHVGVSVTISIEIGSENIFVSTSRMAWTRATVGKILKPKLYSDE